MRLTIQEKLEMIKEVEDGASYRETGEKYGITSPSSVAYIVSQKENYLKLLDNELNVDGMRRPKDVVTSVDIDVKNFVNRMEEKNMPITTSFISQFSRERYSIQGVENFQGSDGYIHRLKKRIKMKRILLHGEERSLNEVELVKWQLKAFEIVAEYGSMNIYNLDETGLFLKKLPESTFVIEDKDAAVDGKENKKSRHGIKQDKTRITLCFVCSEIGEKRRVIVIGRSAKPRCFSCINFNHDKLPVDYYWNENAWMTKKIFTDVIQKWDEELRISNRKILLLLDNFSGHYIEYVPSNIKFLFFMPNSTCKSQPLDAGIIKCFKDKYIGHYQEYVYDLVKNDPNLSIQDAIKSLTIYKAILFSQKAWDNVHPEKIVNCWQKTGLRCSDPGDNDHDHSYSNKSLPLYLYFPLI